MQFIKSKLKASSTSKVRNQLRPSEHEEQVTVIQWAELQCNKYPELECLYAIPNGGNWQRKPFITKSGKKLPPLPAVKLKREGLRRGFPDLCLPVARCGYHALYIEMKVGDNKLSPEQKDWSERLQRQGNFVVTCYGADEAIQVITHYLKGN